MRFLSLCMLLAVTLPAFAQSAGRISGKILGAETKSPLAYATVTVTRTLNDGTDSLIGGTLVTENGSFLLTGLPDGPLTLRVRYLGYKDWVGPINLTSPRSSEQDLGTILMIADSQVLQAVEITAEQASTTMGLEKRVFNVDKSLNATGGTAEDVMKNVPSVTVDMDGNAKLRDRATTIYIDGKPTLLTLSQIPADQIESVEVISNPSAKYEASAMGGIVS